MTVADDLNAALANGKVAFDSRAAADRWIEERARALGGKRRLYASDEYKAAYPAIMAAHEAEKNDEGKRAIEHCKARGMAHGDKIKIVLGSSLFGPIWREGTLDLSGKMPVGILDEPFFKPGAKRGIRKVNFPRTLIA